MENINFVQSQDYGEHDYAILFCPAVQTAGREGDVSLLKRDTKKNNIKSLQRDDWLWRRVSVDIAGYHLQRTELGNGTIWRRICRDVCVHPASSLVHARERSANNSLKRCALRFKVHEKFSHMSVCIIL